MPSASTEADKWYKVKLNFIMLDERTEKEKKTAMYYLVQAKDIDDARRLTDAFMSPTAIDYTTEAVQETKIMDVFLYNPDGSLSARSEKIISHTPLGRFGTPEDLSGSLLFLADETYSGFITGVILPVDGGFSAYSGV